MLTIAGILGLIFFLFSDMGKITAIGLLGLIGHGLVWFLLLAAALGAFK